MGSWMGGGRGSADAGGRNRRTAAGDGRSGDGVAQENEKKNTAAPQGIRTCTERGWPVRGTRMAGGGGNVRRAAIRALPTGAE